MTHDWVKRGSILVKKDSDLGLTPTDKEFWEFWRVQRIEGQCTNCKVFAIIYLFYKNITVSYWTNNITDYRNMTLGCLNEGFVPETCEEIKLNSLLRHNYIAIPNINGKAKKEAIATVVMNLSYYGYSLNVEAYKALAKLSQEELIVWWSAIETELKSITGDDRKIGDFVVYKNFPAEVLDKSEAEYWLAQILMYWGFPNELFTQDVEPRAKMKEQPKLTVLRKSNKSTLSQIFNSYLVQPARWKNQELKDVAFLSDYLPVNLGKLAFKENMVALATRLMETGKKINISTATDVLRLAAGMSDGDISLREKVVFKSFKKSERRFLLSLLEKCSNLEEDFARRKEVWKRLIHLLHPGDYKKQFPRVCKVMDGLYKGNLVTFNASVEDAIARKDPKALKLLAKRPGEFRRRLVHTTDVFGVKAVNAFVKVADQLTTGQIVSLRSLLNTINSREHRTFPPKGNWSKLQLGAARPMQQRHANKISATISKILAERIPAVKVLDPATAMIKLPSNDGEVSPYNRGTVFPIPEDVKFIRTASYWKTGGSGNIWFDNGWNFFDEDWISQGACCWTEENFNGAAVFSGDPTNSKEMQGRAAQLIDLYPDKLVRHGVRYAVWNVLCYSRMKFSEAEDVFAALQWGTDPQAGKLFEPSRCQLAFPLKGDSLAKYVCVIDLVERKMIYIDANLKANVHTAASNGNTLQEKMPAFMEYIDSLPSVYDLFKDSVKKRSGKLHVLYSDKDVGLPKGGTAYVFRPENEENKYKTLDINSLLS